MRYVFVFVESDLRGKFFYRFKNALTKKRINWLLLHLAPLYGIELKERVTLFIFWEVARVNNMIQYH